MILRLKRINYLDRALFIDDGSRDLTKTILQKHSCHFITHDFNLGVGASIQDGIKYAIKNKIPYIIVMAGDDQDDPREIPFLIAPIENGNYDFIQGSRYLNREKHAGVIYKIITTKIYSLVFSILCGRKITDASNGFRAFRTSIFLKVNMLDKNLLRYEFEPFLFFSTIKYGFRIKEIAVHKYYNVKRGYTKMTTISSFFSIIKPLIYFIFKKVP